jgi:hypothetical protein
VVVLQVPLGEQGISSDDVDDQRDPVTTGAEMLQINSISTNTRHAEYSANPLVRSLATWHEFMRVLDTIIYWALCAIDSVTPWALCVLDGMGLGWCIGLVNPDREGSGGALVWLAQIEGARMVKLVR